MSRKNRAGYDLIVIGGGPGGSTVASLVAKSGHSVLLLEKAKFPRYQIGESLLPATIHGICKLLGVSEEIASANFVKKLGGTFRWGKTREPWTFDFAYARINQKLDFAYAYQVKRAEFDHLLLKNSRRLGVRVREGCSVNQLIGERDRFTGVQYLDAAGNQRTAHAKYIVDASGHQSRVYQNAGERLYSKFFQNIALFGYFHGGKRLPVPRSGNIFSVAFDEGWFWYIPLSDTLTSVGAVIASQHARQLQRDPEEALARFISRCPEVNALLSGATRVRRGIYSKLRIRKDYSYAASRFWKSGLILVGDAACFVDPVFSSGVHLATYGALLAARSINTCLKDRMSEKTCFNEFERRYRDEYASFYDFLLGFYDMHQDADSYFWNARKVLNSAEKGNEAFLRLVAGAGTTVEDFLKLRQNCGELFQLRVEEQEARGPKEKLQRKFHAAAEPGAIAAFLRSREVRFRTTQSLLSQAQLGVVSDTNYNRKLGIAKDGLHWIRS